MAAAPCAAQNLVRPKLPADSQLFDLILRSTDDPDLLSARQATLRQKLLDNGVDPVRDPQRITLATRLRQHLAQKADWPNHDVPRQVEILEVDWKSQLVTVFRFPETHLFYTVTDTNLVGVAFEAPRDVADSTVSVEVVGVQGWTRKWVAIGLEDRWWQTLQTRHRAAQEGGELLNFTIPVKLPRTLERIIGKGEKTNIRITGQESISISGQSTVSDDTFVGNEINQNRSLFPSLEMQQTLRVNLDGQVGEKIKVRVTHDSEAIGPQATQVKLGFEGDEDDIVQAIRAGNIDVTLPGSRLLGVRASQGGLFGVKVEGAVGPVKYTVLTSKEQSETNRSSFNQSGGTEEEFVIPSTDYIKNRFFRLTAPVPFYYTTGPDSILVDQSGSWPAGWRINQDTVELFVSDTRVGNADENTFENGRAYVDRDGFGFFPPGAGPQPTAIPNLAGIPHEVSAKWRRLEPLVEWSPLQSRGEIIGVVLNRALVDNGTEALGVTYEIADANGNVVRRVGRPFEQIPDPEGGAEPIYYFKLLKAKSPDDPFHGVGGTEGDFDITWEYMYRNFYDLKGSEIAPASFQLRIERNDPSLDVPELDDTKTYQWFRVFGLDREDAQRQPNPDDQPDIDNDVVFNFFDGYVQFPMLTPFDPPQAALDEFVAPGYTLASELRAPDLYLRPLRNQSEIADNHFFNIVVRHASTSSRFRLNAFNIKNGSEEVTLDGRTLQRGVDYDIDYFSGEIQLTGAAAELNSQSNINVTYEIDPLFGGGRTSLNGIYLGYDISPRQSITTTWLMQSKPNASQKPRLGEEPSRTWVGNVATKFQFTPPLLRRMVNWLPLVNSGDAVITNLDAEAAISIPNPNTRRSAYLEDFEAVDESDTIAMTREGWFWASLPVSEDALGVERRFAPEDRAYSRWHRPVPGVKRGDLNPRLSEQEERDIVPSLQLRFESNDPSQWQVDEFAGIMRGFAGEIDLSRAQFLEFWVNDFTGDGTDIGKPREGILHFDFGVINEDFFWPRDDNGDPILNTYQTEDRDNNFLLNIDETGRSEDTGLDGLLNSEGEQPVFPQRPGRSGDPAGDDFDPSEVDPNDPFPYILGTEANQRLDSEDLNRNTVFDQRDGYFTLSLDLADTNTFADIYEDYADDAGFIAAARERGDAWRKYRLDLRHLTVRRALPGDGYQQATPDLQRVRYFRIWFENPGGTLRDRKRTLIFSEMRFLGSRWLADGIRTLDDQIVQRGDASTEDFRLGVVNNKENEDYIPPITPDVQNNVEEKEQSLQMLYTDLEAGHQVRVRKDVPGTLGQDFTVYGQLNFYWRAPIEGSSLRRIDIDPDQQHLECFTWVGSDSLNYYEIAFAFEEMKVSQNPGWDGWVPVRVDLGQLTNLKNNGREEPLFPGSSSLVTRGDIVDPLTGETYHVTIRGRPDIRRVKRYYAGVRHKLVTTSGGQILRAPISGNVLFNELRLKEVDREVGLAKRVAMNTNIPGLGDVGLEWSETDPSFRGLDQRVGRQLLNRDWNARFGSNLSNWVPTFGIDIPFSLAANRTLQLPRFVTNSDVELLTDQERQDERTEERRERFNFQVRKRQPSTNKILQYTIDRFSYSLSGSRAKNVSPRERIRRKSADTKYNYDVRFARGLEIGLPFTRSRLRLLPSQISLGSAWRDDETRKTSVFPDGTVKVEQPRFVKTVNNDMSVTYSPLPSIRATLSMASQRDRLLGQGRMLGIDFGEEKAHNERISVNYKPDNRLLRWFEPDINYTGAYGENRRPALQSYGPDDPRNQDGTEIDGIEDGLRGIPGQVRHINNNTDLSIRASIKLTQWMKRRWGSTAAQRPTTPSRDERRDRSRINTRRDRDELPTPSPLEPAPTDTTQGQPPAGEDEEREEGEPPLGQLEPEEEEEVAPTPAEETQEEILERMRQEAERAREEALRQQEQEPPPPEEVVEGEAPAEGEEEDAKFDPGSALKSLVRPFWNFVVNLQPITGNYQRTTQSGFQHVNERGSFLYRLGVTRDPGIDRGVLTGDDQFYSTNTRRDSERLSLSTQTEIATNIRLDMSFTGNRGRQQGSTTGERRDYSVEWPNATLRVANVHKWRIFGEMLTASSMDFSVRKTRTASGVTDQVENPRVGVAYSPRWNLSFRNGLDASVSFRLNKDQTTTANSELRNNRTAVSLTLSKKFDAEGALGFLRFGKRGTGSTIDMRVDSSYDRSFQERLDTITNRTNQQTGRTNLSIRPSFSYLFSRNLRAGLELSYSRGNDLSRQAVTQSVGLGFNATLTF